MMNEQTREQLVNRITTLRGEGRSRGDMAKSLNGEGLKTPAGKDWTDVLIGAFMNRMSISSPVKAETTKTESKPSGKEINKVMATAKKGGRKPAKVFKRAPTATPATEFAARPAATGGVDQDLVAIVTSVITGPLTRDQKVRAFSALI